MTTSILPDVNVWLAFVYSGHEEHIKVQGWFEALPDDCAVCFCRVTQMGLLRLLTQRSVLGTSCLTQEQAWAAYDSLLADSRIIFKPESPALNPAFRSFSSRSLASPKLWTDDYLLAFAQAEDLKLVTLDQALAARSADVLLPLR